VDVLATGGHGTRETIINVLYRRDGRSPNVGISSVIGGRRPNIHGHGCTAGSSIGWQGRACRPVAARRYRAGPQNYVQCGPILQGAEWVRGQLCPIEDSMGTLTLKPVCMHTDGHLTTLVIHLISGRVEAARKLAQYRVQFNRGETLLPGSRTATPGQRSAIRLQQLRVCRLLINDNIAAGLRVQAACVQTGPRRYAVADARAPAR